MITAKIGPSNTERMISTYQDALPPVTKTHTLINFIAQYRPERGMSLEDRINLNTMLGHMKNTSDDIRGHYGAALRDNSVILVNTTRAGEIFLLSKDPKNFACCTLTPVHPLFDEIKTITSACSWAKDANDSSGGIVLDVLKEWVIARDPNKELDLSAAGMKTLPELPRNVQHLKIIHNRLQSLSGLPPGLKTLEASHTGITTIVDLPESLTSLQIFNAPLSHLPARLPGGLLKLNIGMTQLTSLPELPPNLTELDACNLNLRHLPTVLPHNLKRLVIHDNCLTELPVLPDGLTRLTVSNNPLTKLGRLPESLIKLEAWDAQLTQMENLPQALTYLDLSFNALTGLPPFPPELRELRVAGNRLISLGTLPKKLHRLAIFNNPLWELPPLPKSLSILEVNACQNFTPPNSTLSVLKNYGDEPSSSSIDEGCAP